MRISRGFFLLAIVGAAALGYAAGRLRNFIPLSLSSGSISPNPNLPSGDQYYVVVPNVQALIDHKKVSANPTQDEWLSTSLPMTKEQCEAQLRQHSESRIGVAGSDGPQRNFQIDVTNLRRSIRVDVWDRVEKYSPDPKDVFRP